MVLRGSIALLLFAACGRFGFDEVSSRDGSTIDTPPQQPNYVFVTEPTLTGALGGLAGADVICNMRAEEAGLEGTYVAFLSTSTTHAIDRVAGARGWIRPDGVPFADTPADLATSRIYAPISIAADGIEQIDSPQTSVMAASDEFGRLKQFANCNDFTTTTGDYWAGRIYAGAYTYINGSVATNGCGSGTARLYCFGIDRVAPLVLPTPSAGRRAFVTKTVWAPAGGLAAADAVCQQAGGPTFRALLATSTTSAASRFDTNGSTWSRLDGVPLAATATQVMAGRWNVPLNVDAEGNYVSFHESVTSTTWGGATAPDQVGTLTCNDWTLNTPNAMGQTGHPHYAGTRGFRDNTYPCDFDFRLYCFEL